MECDKNQRNTKLYKKYVAQVYSQVQKSIKYQNDYIEILKKKVFKS